MTAMIAVGAIIVLFSIVFMLLLVVAVASRRFRGAAVGLMLMSLVGGTAFLVFTYFIASQQMRRVRAEKASAEIAQQRLLVERSLADAYREGIVLDDDLDAAESVVVPSVSAEIANPEDMTVEVISEDPSETGSEPSVAPAATSDDSSNAPTDDEVSEPDDSEPDDTAATDTAATDEAATDDAATDEASTETVVADEPEVAVDSQDQDVQPYEAPNTFQVPRPMWLTSPPKTVDGRPAEVIVSDAYVTGDECEANLQTRIAAAIQRYASEQSRESGGPRSVAIRVDSNDIRRVSRDRHLEIVQTSVGPMKQIHQLVVFDKDFERRAKQQVTQAVVGTRLAATGAVSGGALILLATSFGLLRIISRSSQVA